MRIPVPYTAALAVLCCVSSTPVTATAALMLDSLGSGSEGNSRFTDVTPLEIDGGGNGVDPNAGNGFEDFDVTGSVSEPAAFSSTFSFELQGIANADPLTGAKLTEGGIDRSSDGDLGIRTGANNGIEQLEGYLLGLDASGLDPSLFLQITEVGVKFIGDPEVGTIINRNDTSKSLTFGFTGSGADQQLSSGFVDVTPLDLKVLGGTSDSEVASVFANSFGAGNFRLTGFKLDVVAVPEPTAVALCVVLAGVLWGTTRKRG